MTNFTGASPRSSSPRTGAISGSLPRILRDEDYTDKMIGFIDATVRGKPFFAYVASHQAPHIRTTCRRMAAPPRRRVRQGGRGAQERLKRQIELGICPPGTQLAERMWFVPFPSSSRQRPGPILGKKMELYAGIDGKPRLPRRPAHSTTSRDRRVREHDLHRVRRQRR